MGNLLLVVRLGAKGLRRNPVEAVLLLVAIAAVAPAIFPARIGALRPAAEILQSEPA
jgi:hypothetical protein